MIYIMHAIQDVHNTRYRLRGETLYLVGVTCNRVMCFLKLVMSTNS